MKGFPVPGFYYWFPVERNKLVNERTGRLNLDTLASFEAAYLFQGREVVPDQTVWLATEGPGGNLGCCCTPSRSARPNYRNASTIPRRKTGCDSRAIGLDVRKTRCRHQRCSHDTVLWQVTRYQTHAATRGLFLLCERGMRTAARSLLIMALTRVEIFPLV